jgi:hypothetical protein
MGDGGFEYHGMGFEAFGAAEEQEVDQMELEVSKEAVHAPTELTPSSMIPSSTSTTEDTSPPTDDSPAVQNDDGSSSNDAPCSTASNDTNAADEWLCDFTNCGKSFKHRHELKYVHNV